MARRGRPRHPDVLTPRQWEVLTHVREGLTNEQIAERLGISRDGVKFHVSEIITKLGVRKRGEAAEWPGTPQSEPSRPSAILRWRSPSLGLRRRPARRSHITSTHDRIAC